MTNTALDPQEQFSLLSPGKSEEFGAVIPGCWLAYRAV